MAGGYRFAMEMLARMCMVICVVGVCCMTVLIFTGVVMRYGFSLGAQFAEPVSIYFSIQLTFYGAALCYRSGSHLRLEFVVGNLHARMQRVAKWCVHGLMAAVSLFMIVYGISLAKTTWVQSYPEFEWVRVGWVYTAIPMGGLITLLFVLEAIFLPALPAHGAEDATAK